MGQFSPVELHVFDLCIKNFIAKVGDKCRLVIGMSKATECILLIMYLEKGIL
jgi:hypothetical protein